MAGFSDLVKPQIKPAYMEKDESVQGAVAAVTDQGGALMKRAATVGRQQANQRGLLNSSMAVGAAQDEVLDVAVPIGTQQAQQDFTRNENERGFNRDIYREDSARLFEGGQRALDRTQDATLQTQRIKADDAQKGLDRTQQLTVANMNLDAADREGVARMLVSYDQIYAQQFNSIMTNTALSKQDREASIKGLQTERQNGIRMTEEAYGVRLDFGALTPKPAAPKPKPAAPKPKPKPAARPAALPGGISDRDRDGPGANSN